MPGFADSFWSGDYAGGEATSSALSKPMLTACHRSGSPLWEVAARRGRKPTDLDHCADAG
jgi:hypothetical protein